MERAKATARAHDGSLFYHLEHQPLERVLPSLVERTLERGWRAVVQAGSEERVEALDTLLWTYREDSFLPHGTRRDGNVAAQPIYLTSNEDNPNGAGVRFLVDGAETARAVGLRSRRLPVRRPRCRRGRQGARALEGGQGRRLRGHLLAAVERRTMGEEGLSEALRLCRPAYVGNVHQMMRPIAKAPADARHPVARLTTLLSASVPA